MTAINTNVARLATTQHPLSIVLSISQPSKRTMPLESPLYQCCERSKISVNMQHHDLIRMKNFYQAYFS